MPYLTKLFEGTDDRGLASSQRMKLMSEALVGTVSEEKLADAMEYAFNTGYLENGQSDLLIEAVYSNTEDEFEDVMDKLQDKHYTSKRNTLNAIIILLMALNNDEKYDSLIEDYQKIRDELNDKYVEDQQSGKISEKQKNNFVELSEIVSMVDTMAKEIKKENLKKKENLTGKDKVKD